MTATLTPPSIPPPAPPPAPGGSASPPPPSSAFRTGRALYLTGGAVLTAVLIGCGAFQVASAVAHSTEEVTIGFGGPIRHVVLEVDAGDLTLRGTEADGVTGRRSVTRGLQAPSFSERVDGDTLRISTDCPTFGEWCDVSYSLDVPAGVTVIASLGSDDLTVSGVDGELNLESGSGDIVVDGARGSLRAETGSGGIRATRTEATSVLASTGSGDVELAFLTGPTFVKADTGSGDVRISVPRDRAAYRVDVDTGSGDQQVDVPTDRSSSRTMTINTGAGDVQVLGV